MDAVAIHVGGMTEADVMIANQLTLDIAIQQSGERILVENGKGAEETMCGERGGDNGEDVRKENRWTRIWMLPKKEIGTMAFELQRSASDHSVDFVNRSRGLICTDGWA